MLRAEVPLSVRAEAGRIWERHRRLFWMLHSAWALASGIVVLVLARERYQLVPWVVLFLAITWVSTLLFGRAMAGKTPTNAPGTAGTPAAPGASGATAGTGAAPSVGAPALAWEVASYVTRVLYQETLFFLLPFYAYSTVLRSPNVLFLVLLGGLALLSCIDLLFDRWLRTRPLFSLAFFAIVAFAAVNLLLPLIAGIPPSIAAPMAALLSVASAALLATRTVGPRLRSRLLLAAGSVLMLALVLAFPQVIPPVPLRLERASFAAGMERRTLTLRHPLPARSTPLEVGRELVVLFDVFSPAAVPATVQLEWWRDGTLVRTSRDVAIVAHANGFRLWDAWHPTAPPVPPGRYRVVLQTSGRRVFGVGRITVEPDSAVPR